MMDIKLRMSIYRMSTHPVINPRGVACNKKVNNVDVQDFKNWCHIIDCKTDYIPYFFLFFSLF